MSIEEMKKWLEALENSVDLVIEDAYNAEQLYGNYPSRQAKVGGLKLLADSHKDAITSLRQAIAEESSATQEPVYQLGGDDGKWTDQTKEQFEYNTKHGWPTRILYTHPQPKAGEKQ